MEIQQAKLQAGEIALIEAQQQLEQTIEQRVTTELEQGCRVDRLAKQKLEQMLKSNQQWIEQRREQLRLQQLQDKRLRDRSRSIVDTIRKSASSTIVLILGTVVATSLGWVWGINTPSTIVCKSRTSFCYQMKWGAKLTASELPKTQCKKTRNRTVCVLPERSQEKKIKKK